MGNIVAQNQTVASTRQLPKGKLGLVIVDLQPGFFPEITYKHGTVFQGLKRVEALVKLAKELRISTTFLEYQTPENILALFGKMKRPDTVETGRTFPSLKDGADHYSRTIVKKVQDGFALSELRLHLKTQGLEGIIIAGYERTRCVAATIRGALANRYSVITSDELLFGDCRTNDLGLTRETIEFFRRQTCYFETAEELMKAVRVHAQLICQETSLQNQ